MINHSARVAIKRKAWDTLRRDNRYWNLVLANFLPWVLQVLMTLYLYNQMALLMMSFGIERALNTPEAFFNYAIANSNFGYFGIFQGLVLLWFTTGINFTALDLITQRIERVRPLQTLFSTFNRDYFFAVLFTWIFYQVFIQAGLVLLVVPAIIWACSYSQAFYVLYSARSTGRRIGSLASLGISGRLMSNSKWGYLKFRLSLLGWSVLNTLTLGLTQLLTAPYLQLANASFYQWVTSHKALDLPE